MKNTVSVLLCEHKLQALEELRKMRKVIGNLYKGILAFTIAGVLITGWYLCYSSVPSQVRLTTEKEQQVNFKLPASASIETTQGKMQAGLYRPLRMVTGASEATYQMVV